VSERRSAKPVVLVPSCNRTLGQHPFHIAGRKYIEAVRLAGGLPLIVPVAHVDELDELLDLADGVLLTGSPSNVHPRHFGEDVRDTSLPLDTERDDWTLPMIPRVIERGISAGGYPGAAVVVGRKGATVWEKGFGRLGWTSDADRVVAEIAGKGGKAIAVQANVAKKAEIERLFAETKKAFGRLDILVNNAGIYEFSPIEGVTEEHFHKQFNLNVLGLILTSQEGVKHFGPGGGSIINISSIASTLAPPNASVYSATKAAVDAVTKSLAKEFGPRNIRVNSINPGMVETEGVHSAGIADSDMRKQTEATTPLGRIGQPQDIAPAAVYLASSDSSWVTGETLYISGGLR